MSRLERGKAGMVHLDDEAFAEMTIGGSVDAHAAAHLTECTQCREELARFQDSVGGFSLATLAWSESRSKQLPAVHSGQGREAGGRLQAAGSRTSGRVPGWVPAWGLATLLALGVAIPVTIHRNGIRAGHAAKGEMEDDAAGLNSPEQIAKDNQLMADVRYELSRSRRVLAGASAGVRILHAEGRD